MGKKVKKDEKPPPDDVVSLQSSFLCLNLSYTTKTHNSLNMVNMGNIRHSSYLEHSAKKLCKDFEATVKPLMPDLFICSI